MSQRSLDYYSDDVIIQLPTETLQGKAAVRDNFVAPFVTASGQRACDSEPGLFEEPGRRGMEL